MAFQRLPEVTTRYKTSRSTLYRWVKEGRFPKPVSLGPRLIAWRESDLQAWEQSRKEAC